MNPLGKIPESYAPSGTIDWNGFLKVLRLLILGALAVFIGAIISGLADVDFLPDTSIDENVIMMFVIPLLDVLRRWIVDYSHS